MLSALGVDFDVFLFRHSGLRREAQARNDVSALSVSQ
jgi:hypothetical protein